MENELPNIQLVKEKGRGLKANKLSGELYAGIDEVGVSSIAGSLVCSVVVLPKDHQIKRLPIDSKVLNDSSITRMATEIEKQALYYAIFAVSPQDVDNNVKKTSMLKLQKRIWERAIQQVRYTFPKIKVILDGKHSVNNPINVEPIIGADRTHDAVSASAILSKHWCDENIRKQGLNMPHYLLAKHKGYPTDEHLDLIREYGITSFHRVHMTNEALMKPKDTRRYTLSEMEEKLREAGDYLKINPSLTNEGALPFLRKVWVMVIQDKVLPSERQQRYAMNVCKDVIKNHKRLSKGQAQ